MLMTVSDQVASAHARVERAVLETILQLQASGLTKDEGELVLCDLLVSISGQIEIGMEGFRRHLAIALMAEDMTRRTHP